MECAACFEEITSEKKIWKCSNKSDQVHIDCVREWAETCLVENKPFTCPLCRLEISIEKPKELTSHQVHFLTTCCQILLTVGAFIYGNAFLLKILPTRNYTRRILSLPLAILTYSKATPLIIYIGRWLNHYSLQWQRSRIVAGIVFHPEDSQNKA